jgi:hypothetical protein
MRKKAGKRGKVVRWVGKCVSTLFSAVVCPVIVGLTVQCFKGGEATVVVVPDKAPAAKAPILERKITITWGK